MQKEVLWQIRHIILQTGGGYDKVTVVHREAQNPQAGEITSSTTCQFTELP